MSVGTIGAFKPFPHEPKLIITVMDFNTVLIQGRPIISYMIIYTVFIIILISVEKSRRI
jgi:hypothetical protein